MAQWGLSPPSLPKKKTSEFLRRILEEVYQRYGVPCGIDHLDECSECGGSRFCRSVWRRVP